MELATILCSSDKMHNHNQREIFWRLKHDSLLQKMFWRLKRDSLLQKNENGTSKAVKVDHTISCNDHFAT